MKSRLTAFIVILVFLVSLMCLFSFFGVSVYAGDVDSGWVGDRRVVPPAGVEDYPEVGPSMATDSEGNLWMAYWYFVESPYYYYDYWKLVVANSTDGGNTWNAITLPGVTYEHWEMYDEGSPRQPSIAIDVGDGNHVFVAFDRRLFGEADRDILVWRYADGSWEGFAVDTDDDNDRYPSITVEYWNGASNRLYISYEQIVTGDDRDLMFAWSDDDGETWTTEKLRGDVDEDVYCQSSITTTLSWEKSGVFWFERESVYIAYKQGANYTNAYDVRVARSTDRGASWNYELAYNGSASSRNVNWPSIAATHGPRTVVVAWFVDVGGGNFYDVQYAYSEDDGVTWGSGWLATEHGEEITPRVTVDGQGSTSTWVYGYVHVVYQQLGAIRYRKALHDSPDVWSSAETVTDPEAVYPWDAPRLWGPGITTQNRSGVDYPCVAWADGRNWRETDNDIYYSTSGAWYTIDTSPPGLEVEVDGSLYTAPYSAEGGWIAGYNHTIDAPAQSPTTGVRYIFESWSDGGAQSHSITVGTVDTTITAYYKTEYRVTVEWFGGPPGIQPRAVIDGTLYDLPESFWWENGSIHDIRVNSLLMWDKPTRYAFTGWSGLSNSTDNELALTVTTTGTLTANYQKQHNVTIDQSGSGATVRATIDGSSYRLPVSLWLNDSSMYTIEAPDVVSGDPGTRFAFAQWDDGETNRSRTVTVTEPANYTANYKTQYQVTFEQSGSEGTPHVTVDGTAYALPQSLWFDNGSQPAFSYETPVSGETGIQYVLTSTSETSPITVTEPMTVTGYYETQYYLTMTTNYGSVTPDSGWYDAGALVTINATPPDEKYVWNGWTGTGNGNYSGMDNPASITMNGPITEEASWIRQYYIYVGSEGDHGDPTPSQWVNEGDNFTASVTSPAETVSNQTQYRCTGYRVDGGELQPGTSYTFENVREDHVISFSWVLQFWLQVDTTVSGSTVTGTGWYDYGTSATVSATTPYQPTSDHQFVFTHWSGIMVGYVVDPTSPTTTVTMNSYGTVTANWQEQWYITVISAHNEPTPSQWVNHGSSLTVSVTSPADDDGAGTRYRCTGYRIDGGDLQEGTSYTFIVQAAHTIEFEWTVQYGVVFTESGIEPGLDIGIIVNDVHHSGTTIYNYTEWVDEGSSVTFIINPQICVYVSPDVYEPHTIYDFVEWKNSAGSVITSPQTISAPDTFTAHYTAQYRLEVESPYGTTSGTGYYDRGSTAYATLDTNNVSGPQTGIRYVFTEWSGNASGTNYAQSDPIIMDAPKTAVASWKTQYYLTIARARAIDRYRHIEIDVDVDIPGEGWYDEGTSVTLTAPSPAPYSNDTQYRFDHWHIDTTTSTTNPITFDMDDPKEVMPNYVMQCKFTVISEFGSPVPSAGEHWYDQGTSINASVTTTISDEFDGTRYSLEGWNGTGMVPPSGTDTWVDFSLYMPSSIQWNWRVQYQLTINSAYGTPSGAGWYDETSTTHATLDTETVSGAAGVRYIFTQWSNDASGTNHAQSDPITMDEPKTATANWKTQYHLTIDTDPTGLTPQPNTSIAGPWYDSGTQLNLTAETIEGYKFDHWDIDGTAQDPGANPISLTMDAPHTATAHYTTVAPAFPLWWLVVIVLIIAAATVIFILARKRALRTKTGALE